MADHDDLDLEREFAAFRNEVLPRVTAAGPTAVRARVRQHRRRVAVTTGSVLALLLVAGPIAGYATLKRDSAPKPEPAVTVDPTAPPTTLPGPSPSPSASAPASVSPSAGVPDGRISLADLLATRVDLPPWPGGSCRTNQARLAENDPRPPATALRDIRYGDVDRDGAQETLVILRCNDGQPGPEQVVAFDRDATGRIVTMGQVAATGQRGIEHIPGINPHPDGRILVLVSDHRDCCGYIPDLIQNQWRTYEFNGAGFVQTAGETEFGPNPLLTDLQVTATDVQFTEQPGDMMRHGTVTVTVRNAGPANANGVRLRFDWDTGVTLFAEGGGWSTCTGRGDPVGITPAENPVCEFGLLRAGQQRTFVLGISYNKDWAAAGTGTAVVERTNELPDRRPADNQAPFAYR
ncbi:hypothetical protein AB0M79_10650 [Polymorphospora sp. NPDC051019]|uniref:hypothetical protein n=1 Tax=Polymorphospora sp. NPDC051019 TaxID=3155725 RepID=UPI0034470EDF